MEERRSPPAGGARAWRGRPTSSTSPSSWSRRLGRDTSSGRPRLSATVRRSSASRSSPPAATRAARSSTTTDCSSRQTFGARMGASSASIPSSSSRRGAGRLVGAPRSPPVRRDRPRRGPAGRTPRRSRAQWTRRRPAADTAAAPATLPTEAGAIAWSSPHPAPRARHAADAGWSGGASAAAFPCHRGGSDPLRRRDPRRRHGIPGSRGGCANGFASPPHDAAKRRLRATTDAGTDIAVDLPRVPFSATGRSSPTTALGSSSSTGCAEEALVLRFSSELPHDLVAAAARLGHAFGNQHAPIAAVAGEFRIPLTTSREIAARTVRALELDGVDHSLRGRPPRRRAPADRDPRTFIDRAAGPPPSSPTARSRSAASPIPTGSRPCSPATPVRMPGRLPSSSRRPSGRASHARRCRGGLCHRAATSAELQALDARSTARKLTPAARISSTTCGGRLAALVPDLTTAEPATSFASAVRVGPEPTATSRSCSARSPPAWPHSGREALLVELRGGHRQASFRPPVPTSARLSARPAQVAERRLRARPPRGVRRGHAAPARRDALQRPSSSRLHALRHARADTRLFIT